MTAMLALIAAARLDPVVTGIALTLRAIKAFAVAGAHDVVQADVIIGVLLEELLDGYGFLAHDLNIGIILTCFKGITSCINLWNRFRTHPKYINKIKCLNFFLLVRTKKVHLPQLLPQSRYEIRG